MPGPAARIGDMTAHGGVIMPPGVPTVLIGGMPAATITAMHVCPMVTGVVPHVGGPVLPPGVPTVLIGGLPAATVGDMAVCVGPPDVIIPPGCPTVLIGTGGGGSGGGGGGAAQSASDSAMNSLKAKPGEVKEGPHWIEYSLKDKAGKPISGVRFNFTDVATQQAKGVLTANGVVKRGNIPDEGDCNLVLFKLFNATWSTNSANVGDEVTLNAQTEGYADGTKALVHIMKKDISGPDVLIEELESDVSGGKIEANWTYQADANKASSDKQYSSPEFYFNVFVEDEKIRSNTLNLQDFVEISLVDNEGNPIANEDYILRLSNGEIRKGKLDGNGYKKEEGVPPAGCEIEFPNKKLVRKKN